MYHRFLDISEKNYVVDKYFSDRLFPSMMMGWAAPRTRWREGRYNRREKLL